MRVNYASVFILLQKFRLGYSVFLRHVIPLFSAWELTLPSPTHSNPYWSQQALETPMSFIPRLSYSALLLPYSNPTSSLQPIRVFTSSQGAAEEHAQQRLETWRSQLCSSQDDKSGLLLLLLDFRKEYRGW